MTDSRGLRRLIGVLALVGIGVAGYLTWSHYAGAAPVCLANGGCETVQKSSYAKLGGVPVALLGLVGYVLIGATALVRHELARIAGFGLAFAGALFSVYLTYLELFVIKAICQWCVVSAVLMCGLVVACSVRFWRALS